MRRRPGAACPTTGPPWTRCPALTTDQAKELFSKFGVLSERELASRVEINWERYVKVQNIEANCALDIARTMILPATAQYLGILARRLRVEGDRGHRGQGRGARRRPGGRPSTSSSMPSTHAHEAGSVHQEARAFVDHVIPAQNALREVADELETLVSDELWPLPKYRELLFQYLSRSRASSDSASKPSGPIRRASRFRAVCTGAARRARSVIGMVRRHEIHRFVPATDRGGTDRDVQSRTLPTDDPRRAAEAWIRAPSSVAWVPRGPIGRRWLPRSTPAGIWPNAGSAAVSSQRGSGSAESVTITVRCSAVSGPVRSPGLAIP